MTKWAIRKNERLKICPCGYAFVKSKHFIEHLKDTKAHRSKHFAVDAFTPTKLAFGFNFFIVVGKKRKK